MADNIILIGASGAGKSTTAKLLASELMWAALDSDENIEQTYGMTISQIFEQKGEAEFRRAEQHWLDDLPSQFTKDGNFVLACGGGLPVAPGNLEKLKALGQTIYLSAQSHTLAARLGENHNRPLLTGSSDIEVKIKDLLMARQERYGQAHLTIHTDEKSTAEVVKEIQRILIKTTF